MPLNHPTDPSFVLDDGLSTFAPTASEVVAGKFGAATKSAALTLSTDARTVSHPAANASNMARSDVAITGEAYYEFTLTALTIPTDSSTGVGLINGTLTNYNTYLTNNNTCGFYSPGGTYGGYSGFGINNAQQQVTALGTVPWVVDTVIGMAVSMSARTVKFTLDGETWSPAYDITALGTTIYPAIGIYHSGESIRINAGKSPFVYDVPSGYAGMDTSTTTYYEFGKVAGETMVYDVGALTEPTGWIAQFELSQIDKTLGENNAYYYVIVGSLDPGLADYEEVSNRWQMSVVGTKPLVAFSTLSKTSNTLLRYFGLLKIASGASPSITAYAFLEPLGALDLYTVNEAIQILCFMAANDAEAFAQFRAWMTGVAWGGVNHDGIYPVSDGYGNITYLKSPAQLQAEGALNSPQYYGAIGDGLSHPASDFYDTLEDLQVKYAFATSLYQEMDFLGTQAALNHGGGVSSVFTNFVMCNIHPESQTPLISVSGTFDITVHGSIWSFPDMSELTDATQYVTNPDFATSGSWVNASIYDSDQIIMTTFGGGSATMIDIGTGSGPGQSTFYQWGQQVTLSPGRYTVTMTANATLGASYALGNVNPAYAEIGFSADSPGEGGNPVGRGVGQSRFNINPDHTTDTKTLTFDCQITETLTAWLTFGGGGYMDCECTHFGIKKWLPNCAILATRDGSPEHYPIPRGFDGLELIGPGGDVNVAAVKYKSFSNMDGNLIRFSNCALHDWGKAFSFGDGAYLTEFNNVNVYACGTGIFTETGTFNAGENIRWIGGGIANCGVAINGQNGAFEITFVTSVWDYCDQMIINGAGRYEFQSVHCEAPTALTADKPKFHLTGGQITMFGGMILITGDPLTSPCTPIHTEFSTATFECFGTELYNLSSDPAGEGKGAIIDGPGQFITHGFRNSGNPMLGPLVVSYAPVMDVLGGAGKFPDPTYSPDPSGILFEGGGFPDAPPQIPITASMAGSILTITGTPAFAVEEGMQIRGAGIKGVPLVSYIDGGGTGYAGDYRISIPQNVSSRSMTAGDDAQVDRWSTKYGTAEWSDEYTYDGSNCFKFTKNNDGLNSAIRILMKVTPRVVSLGFVHFLFPVDYSPVDPDETVKLFYRVRWVRSIGKDDYKRPIIVKELAAGETDLDVPRAGSLDWQLRSLLTTYNDVSGDPSTESSTHAPEWATHLAIFLDTQSLPAGQVFYMANINETFLR